MGTKNEAPVWREGADSATPNGAAWDPYEVWLNRVKKPRDQRVTPTAAPPRASAPDLSDTARMRVLVLPNTLST
jgi:hypothetical protein